MASYQQADAEATTQLVARLSPQVFGFYLNQLRDRVVAEDLLQDFWLRLHKARASYRPGELLLPWVYAIARRVLADYWRKNKSIREHELHPERLPDAPDGQHYQEQWPTMQELLQTLPPTQREVILLLKVCGLSLDEVARSTGSSVGSVKQKAYRGYQALRKLFGDGL